MDAPFTGVPISDSDMFISEGTWVAVAGAAANIAAEVVTE
jgi:hypothetical protein